MSTRHDRHYTLEEARAELPWVARQLAAMRAARERLTDARETLTERSQGNGGGGPGRQPDDAAAARSSEPGWRAGGLAAGEAFLELQAGLEAFEDRGIVLRDLDRGLIDFPAFREDREVYLCWIDGEADIEFWHDLDAGYAGRQPL